MTATEILIIAAVTIAGSIIHGTTGIGLGLVAGPALLSVDPKFVPGPILLASMIVGVRHIVVEWRTTDRNILRRLCFGLPFGTAAALIILTTVNERVMAICIGALVILASAALLGGFEFSRTPRNEVVGGAAASFGAVAAALPGPPLVMALHDTPGPVLRPTISLVNALISAVGMVGLALVGLFGWAELQLLALLTPFVLIGLFLARFVRPWLDRSFFRPTVLCLSLAGGAALLFSNL